MGRNSRQRKKARARKKTRKGIDKDIRRQRDQAMARARGEEVAEEVEYEAIDPNTGDITRIKREDMPTQTDEEPFQGASVRTLAVWGAAAAAAVGVIAYILAN